MDFNQFIREISRFQLISKQTGLSIAEITEIAKVLEMQRQSDLYRDNGDIHDEQMSGLGYLFQELNENLQDLNNNMSDFFNNEKQN